MKLLAGILIGVVLVLGAEYLFLTQGGMPVRARGAKPLPLERFLTSRALHVAMAKEANRPPPISPGEANLLAGARVYRASCVVCHGALGEERRSAIAVGMFPRPPALMPPAEGVSDDPPGETYWKVRNGIRITGMPGFEGALTDTQMWQVSLLLSRSAALPAAVQVQEALRSP
jgi:thiosulfate dehydrogenase